MECLSLFFVQQRFDVLLEVESLDREAVVVLVELVGDWSRRSPAPDARRRASEIERGRPSRGRPAPATGPP
jgi:hypothetical protein